MDFLTGGIGMQQTSEVSKYVNRKTDRTLQAEAHSRAED